MAAVSCLFAVVAAAPAGAVVTEVEVAPSAKVAFGVEPHSVAQFSSPTHQLTYHGGPVMHSNATFAIYWDPTQAPPKTSWNYDGDWKAMIDEYFKAVGSQSGTLGNVYAATSQYTDSTNERAAYKSTFRGAYTDTNPYPTTGNCTDPAPEPEREVCLTDAQLRTELSAFITTHGLPTGMGTIFFILTPPGVTVCTDAGGSLTGHCSDSSKKNPWAAKALVPSLQEEEEQHSYERSFCSYHAFMGSESNPTIYAVVPWTAGNLAMYMPFSKSWGAALGSDCQDGSQAQQEPNQLLEWHGLDSDGDYDRGLADLVINEIGVEQIAAETDPLLNGWYAPSTQANAWNEVPDQCRNFFGVVPMKGESTPPPESRTGAGTLANQTIGERSYYLNDEFSQAAILMDYPGVACLPAVKFSPAFTAPNPVNSGEVVGFDAGESDISLDAGWDFKSTTAPYEPYEVFPTYNWSFGDGTQVISTEPPGAAKADEPSVFHFYQYGGTYTVTLTITDVGGNTRSTSRAITVDGPPPPPPPSTTPSGTGTGGASTASAPSTSSTIGSSSTTATGSTPGSTPAGPLAAPALTDSIVSRSLRKIASLGLALRYTVNEQVAGRVEAILDAATAKRLHIKARTALGLPKGYPKSVVVGQAVLVTTMGGHGVVRLRFSTAIAKRLAHAGHVTLTLRFVVRNASRTSPQTTTTLSKVVLGH